LRNNPLDAKSLINLSILGYWFSFGVYTSFWYFGLGERSTRTKVLIVGLALQLLCLTCRGMAIEYFPLTNKFESFYAFSTATFLVLFWTNQVESLLYRLTLFGVGYGFMVAAAFWPKGLSYPPPLMLTIWYVLHVPLSFMCYAFWTSSLAAGVAYFLSSAESPPFLGRDVGSGPTTQRQKMLELIDNGFMYGLLGFSVSMLFGGLWGYVAWGDYFLWDAKVVWSVILWLFYSACIHVDHWPAIKGYKPHLAVAGFLIMFFTYVGTSFFISSSHRF
jgi:ABC-type transport system involved in cytochrome c biogenesis permease subunit